jgi:hypothetical protein
MKEIEELTAVLGRYLEARRAADKEMCAAILLLVEMFAGREQATMEAPRPKPFEVYKPKRVQQELGISESTYYELIAAGLLPYTRLTPGGDRVHLTEHLETYHNYLLEKTKGGDKASKPTKPNR